MPVTAGVAYNPDTTQAIASPRAAAAVEPRYTSPSGIDGRYTATFTPDSWGGADISYYIAVGVVSRSQGLFSDGSIHPYLGLGFFPFGEGGAQSTFSPLVGGQFSAWQHDPYAARVREREQQQRPQVLLGDGGRLR